MKRLNGPFKTVAACALAAASVLAHGAEAGDSADELLGNATLALKRIDAGDYTALWQQTAPFVRGFYTPDRFASGLTQARKSVGAVSQRGWASVTRLTYTKVKDVPEQLPDFAGYHNPPLCSASAFAFQLGRFELLLLDGDLLFRSCNIALLPPKFRTQLVARCTKLISPGVKLADLLRFRLLK